MKKVTLKHMQENGRVATRTTARNYTHVLLCKVDNKVAADALESTRMQEVDRAAKDARRQHKFDLIWAAAKAGDDVPFRPGQGGYRKFADNSYATWPLPEALKKLADESIAKHPTVETAIADAIAHVHADIDRRIASLKQGDESWRVISWHSRADLAKPGYTSPGSIYKVEAINGGVRADVIERAGDVTDLEKVLTWADDEYKRRTQAVKTGESTNVDWLEPSTRVCVTDIMTHAKRNGLNVDRFELQEAIAKRSGRRYT